MKGSLARILRLRALIEEESRLRLERLSLESNRIEIAHEAERQLASTSRASAFSLLEREGLPSLENSDARAQDTWLVAVLDGNLAGFREERLQALRKTSVQRVEAGRNEMLQLRKERQQAEILLRHEGERRETELERNRQRTLDDWYAAAFFRRRTPSRDQGRS